MFPFFKERFPKCDIREGEKKAALGVGQLSWVYLLDMGISGIICSKRSFF